MSTNTELRKALTTADDGQYLLGYDLAPALYEELLELQPLAMMLQFVAAKTKTHEYRIRDAHPRAWYEGEETPAANQESSYTTKNVSLKIQRIWGSVSGFLQATADFADALATEVSGSMLGMSDILEYGVMFGAGTGLDWTGDAYQVRGLLPWIFSEAPANVIDAGGNKLTLTDLDNAIAKATEFRGSAQDPKAWLMSVQMKLVADGLQSSVSIPLTSMEMFDGKLVMASYADIPILQTAFLKQGTGTSPQPTLTANTSGGTLSAQDYNYRISSIHWNGEQVGGSAATTAATVSTATGSVDLSWTPDTDAKSYWIFRQDGGSGDYKLIDIIAAKTYDAAGSLSSTVSSYTDTGKTANDEIQPLESGEETIVLVNTNPQRGVALMYLNDNMGTVQERLFNYVELARTKDTYDYMIKTYLAVRLIYPETCAVVRHAKLA